MRRFGLRSWWRRFPLRAKTMVVAGIPIVLLLLGVPTLIWVQRDAAQVSHDVEHAYRVRESLATVLQDLTNAETGIRGYLLTNDATFLDPYRQAVDLVPADLIELEGRLDKDPATRQGFRELQQLSADRLAILEQIRRFGARTPVGEIPEDLLERGRAVMEEIRAVVDDMDRDEADALAASRGHLRTAQRWALVVSVFVIPLALLLTLAALLGFTGWLVRGIRRIEENARRLERGEPLLDPPHGDDELANLGRVLAQTGARLAEQEAELRELALEDALTGLPNRRAFHQIAEHELQIAIRRSSVTALLFVDVDGLKAVNDQHGHAEGDEMLREVASVLRSELRASDLLARLGGDEFCVLLSRDSALDGSDLLHRIDAAVAARNEQPGRRYELGFSVGVAFFDPADPITVDQLVQRADADMYQHKQAKRVARMVAS